MKPLSFIIAGSGWRSLFYVRIAKQFPELFELKYMLCRTQEKADRIAAEYGIATTVSEKLCELSKPDFVVIAVTKGSIFAETKKWSDRGLPILSETPVGAGVEELKAIWDMVQKGAKIQVAEQYHRYPIMAAGLKAIEEEKLGNPHAVTLSVAHDYHGISLIRHMLQPKNPMELKLKYICGSQYVFPVTETNSRMGAMTDGSVKDRSRTVMTLQFANGKTAFYDFDKVQYHSFIRARHLNVQSAIGEWNDTILRYVDANHLPVTEKVTYYLNPRYACLETQKLRNQCKEWSPFVCMDDAQDEYAMATMLLDMREYITHGVEVYPLAEALEDTYIWLLFQEAVKYPNKKIIPESMPWE